MIYFLVNNDYQYLEAERLARELRVDGQSCSLIAVPHTLTRAFDTTLFRTFITLETPARLRWPQAWLRYLFIQKTIRKALSIAKADTLFLFTEFELLNQLVAIHFKDQGAHSFLIEDGGVGTYIPLAIKHPQPYSRKDRVYQWMVRLIPRLHRTQFTKFDGINFPMLDDAYLDGVCLYRNMSINRQVPVRVIQRPSQLPMEPIAGRVVFLNQPLYCEHIQTEADYERGLSRILEALSLGFGEVLFKFHPRETPQWQAAIAKSILSKFPNVRMVQKKQPFESMLAELRPEAVASYNSTPLLNLNGTGVQPLFVYHLLDDLRHASSFDTMHALLEAWGYEFATSWKEVASGYRAGDRFDRPRDAQSIVTLVNRHDETLGVRV